MALQVGTRAGGLVQGQLQGPLAKGTLRQMSLCPSTELKGVKALWELLWAAGWTLQPRLGPGKHFSFQLDFSRAGMEPRGGRAW